MAISDVAALLQMAASSSQKDVVLNTITSEIEGLLAGGVSYAVPSGAEYELPFSAEDLGDRSGLHNFYITLTDGGVSAGFDLIHPAYSHMFILDNQTGQTVTVPNPDGSTANIVTVTNGLTAWLYCDGDVIIDLLANIQIGGASVDRKIDQYNVHHLAEPKSDEVLADFMCPYIVNFEADFAGSVGTCDTPPSSSFNLIVQDDGATIGTVTVNTDGTLTFATSGNSAQTVDAGSRLTVTVQSGAVDPCSGLVFSLACEAG